MGCGREFRVKTDDGREYIAYINPKGTSPETLQTIQIQENAKNRNAPGSTSVKNTSTPASEIPRTVNAAPEIPRTVNAAPEIPRTVNAASEIPRTVNAAPEIPKNVNTSVDKILANSFKPSEQNAEKNLARQKVQENRNAVVAEALQSRTEDQEKKETPIEPATPKINALPFKLTNPLSQMAPKAPTVAQQNAPILPEPSLPGQPLSQAGGKRGKHGKFGKSRKGGKGGKGNKKQTRKYKL